MKCKFYFLLTTLLMLLIAQSLVAQNVGIGTENPMDKLEVSDEGSTDIRITSTNSTGPGLTLNNLGIVSDWRIFNGSGSLLFGRGDADGAMPSQVIFRSDGRFGFGDTTPDTDFEVAVGSTSTELRITASNFLGRPKLDLMAGLDNFATYHWRLGQENRDFVLQYGRNEFAFDSIEVMRADDDGRIGFGTNNPESHVHIAGTENQNLRVHTTNSGSSQAGIELVRSNEFNGTDWKIVNDGGTLRFMDAVDNFDTEGTENMRIRPNGNIGIGQTLPEAKLHVTGTSSLNASSGGDFLKVGSSTGSYVAMDANEIGARNGSDEPSTLFLQYWGGNLSLASENSGRVGIGNQSPNAKLHITDGADVNVNGGGELQLGATNDLNMALDGNEIQGRNAGEASHLIFQQGGGDLMLIPGENGQVGIGISSVGNLPPSEYLLAVDGKIMSEEVRVEMSGNWWPDYVFEEGYALTSLADLEKEIKDIGHLPGIPSAAEVENEGIELGDMQKRIMEKIEELTLYMIEANKEIQLLKAEKNKS